MKLTITIVALTALFALPASAGATAIWWHDPEPAEVLTWRWDNGEGFSATATVEQTSARQLVFTVENTSTAWPTGLRVDSSNQLLTSISFDTGVGANITGGSAVLGDGAFTVNFDDVWRQLDEGDSVSSEWGYSNKGYKINLARNVITTLQSQATRFSTHDNLDGPSNLSGPQGGIAPSPLLTSLGGLGAIQGPVIFTVNFDRNVCLGQLTIGSAEWGSDAYFAGGAAVPEPATIAFLAVGGLTFMAAAKRRRKLGRQ